MAKSDSTINGKAKHAALTPTLTPAASAGSEPSPESLDQVRDILFGGQMRTVETRLKGVESRLSHEQEVMRAEFTKRMAEIDAFARKETQALHERLAAENDARAAALKALTAEIRDAHKAIDKRHSALEESTSLSDAELRDQLLAHAKAAANELSRVHDRLANELSKSHEHLSSTKTDRAALATLLTDVATRLTGANAKGNQKS
jgi:predicted  nucleic acid-binding Zn-ribbon protein